MKSNARQEEILPGVFSERDGKAENDRERLDFGETSGRGCGMMEIQKDPDRVTGGIV